jgi:hypothetical protein
MMRFKPWPRPTSFEDTSRKRAAYRRKQVREQAALPLLATVIAERQLDVDEEMIRRTGQWERQQQESRRQRAGGWRRARARLFEHPDPGVGRSGHYGGSAHIRPIRATWPRFCTRSRPAGSIRRGLRGPAGTRSPPGRRRTR